MNRACVQVLLSTYNGEKYIIEQVSSIFNQKGVNINCLIRDDGSRDNTRKILSELLKKYNNLEVIWGNNIGYEASFFELIAKSGDHDYYAFSDHDDVWLPEKISVAIESIESKYKNSPCLYFSNCTIVDAELNRIELLHSDINFIPNNKIMGLAQGFAHGCTIVFNQKSKDLILSYIPKGKYPHDFWIPLVHLYIDKIIYDRNSYILYRQHSENVYGNRRSVMKLLKGKTRFIFNKSHYYSRLASDIMDGYEYLLSAADRRDLEKIINYRNSLFNWIKTLFNNSIKRNTLRGTILLKILILFRRF